RADLYSLGCTLYHLLAGAPPFPGGSLTEKLLKHQQAEPQPVEQLRPDAPAALAAVGRKLMAKRPADRHQTPGELAEALAPLCGGGVSSPGLAGAVAVPVARPVGGGASATAPLALRVAETALAGYVPPEATLATTPGVMLASEATVATPPTAPGSAKKRQRRLLAAAGAGLLLLLGLVVLLWPRGKRGGGDGPEEAKWPLDNLEPAEIGEV